MYFLISPIFKNSKNNSCSPLRLIDSIWPNLDSRWIHNLIINSWDNLQSIWNRLACMNINWVNQNFPYFWIFFGTIISTSPLISSNKNWWLKGKNNIMSWWDQIRLIFIYKIVADIRHFIFTIWWGTWYFQKVSLLSGMKI